MKLKVLYLDVDGVLLGKADPKASQVVLAPGAREFLAFCTENFFCFWLTSHCRDGNIDPLLQLFARYADADFIALARKVVPAHWNTLKTEAIDFFTDFYWLDDQLLQAEIEVLKHHHALTRWLMVNTRKEPQGLLRILEQLKKKSRER